MLKCEQNLFALMGYSMAEIICWVGVNMDGTGDFVHGVELFQAIKEHHKLKDLYRLTLVVAIGTGVKKLDESWRNHYERFRQKLATLNLPPDRCYFGTHQELESRLDSSEFRERCLSATQHITISCPTELLQDEYQAPGTTIKYICEHESQFITFEEGVLLRGMGLAPHRYGIKIPTIPEVPAETAMSLLQQNDADFWEVLLTYTHAQDSTVLMENNFIFPAYFSDHLGLGRFLLLLSNNDSLPQDKNYVVYLSSIRAEKNMVEFIKKTSLPTSSPMKSIKQFELIEKRDDRIVSETININPEGRVIRIFCNFHVNDAAFDALYHTAELAGVSGDTSFERAVAFRTLPFYFSNNYSAKKETLITLQKIISHVDLGIPEDTKRDFLTYFKYEEKWHRPIEEQPERSVELTRVDLARMMAEWPKVANYLSVNFNLYNWLPELINEEFSLQEDDELADLGTRNPAVYATLDSRPSALIRHSQFSPKGDLGLVKTTDANPLNKGNVVQLNVKP